MISFSAGTLIILERSRQLVRDIAFDDMKQIARGWGLSGDCPSSRSQQKPTIDLHFSTQSRRALFKRHKLA